MKALSRSRGNTVRMLAYRAGTQLKCQKTAQMFTYTHKPVAHVELLLPVDAPLWAVELQTRIAQNRQKGVQQFSDLAESCEKRQDSQVYREWEFALPAELSYEQSIEFARAYMQDQACGRGMTVLLNFHFDVDEETGQRKPHCHAVMLTRRLTEQGLSRLKERAWENWDVAGSLREQFASYTNFYLALHGHATRIDHRSYAEQGLDLEAQSKLGRGVIHQERSAGNDPRHGSSATVTEKGAEFQRIKLRNLYRLVKNPELVFEIATRSQATFMWGDIEAILVRYIDDPVLYHRLNTKLQASAEVVLLGEHTIENKEGVEVRYVYTTRTLLKTEQRLVDQAMTFSQRATHTVRHKVMENVMRHWDAKFAGGLSADQKTALRHMVKADQLSTVVGYAGAGKTTVLEAAKEIWKGSGYKVLGLAPTGRAAQNLQSVGIAAQTVHKFLKGYAEGRHQLAAKTVLVLDEAGMVDIHRFEALLTVCRQQGVKLVSVGDGAQLQSVEAGAAFRLITERTPSARLETVIRQRIPWQQEATQMLGRCQTADAVQRYYEAGCIHLIEEPIPDIAVYTALQAHEEMVSAYNLSRRMAGTLYHDILQDLTAEHGPIKDIWQQAPAHPDYERFKEWKEKRLSCAAYILDNLEACRSLLTQKGVDPVQLAANFVEGGAEGEVRQAQARALAQQWNLPRPAPDQPLHACDVRRKSRVALLDAWRTALETRPENRSIILTYANKDAQALNQQARQLMRDGGQLQGPDRPFVISIEERNDFHERQERVQTRNFAMGDRLIFLRNDQGLKVKNGTLGTVQAVTPHTIQVQLDEEARVVSFAPKLYSAFDHGYATTIHKAQGVTVDESFVLATHQTFRNLAYVALTRHKQAVHVYGSTLDFWRPEKTWNVLSRSREKLSSFDYSDTATILQHMQRDDTLLCKTLERLGHRIAALQVVSVEAWRRLAERFMEMTRPAFFPHIESVLTEAERADLLWAPKSSAAEPMITEGLFPLIGTAVSRVSLEGLETGVPGAVMPSLVLSSPPRAVLFSSSPLDTPFPDALDASTSSAEIEEKATGADEKKRQRSKKQDKTPQTQAKTVVPVRFYKAETVIKSLNPARIEQLFTQHMDTWVDHLPCRHQGHELRFGRSGGFVVNATNGLWFDHYSNNGGDLFKFIAQSRGIKDSEAIHWVGEWAGSPLTEKGDYLQQKAQNEATLQIKHQEDKKKRAAALQATEKVYRFSKPIQGTLGETYLRKFRGIQRSLPDSLRFVAYHYNDGQKYPALVAFTTDDQGQRMAHQNIALDPATGDKARALTCPKKTHGILKGAAVRIQEGTAVTYVAEGVETALSLREAGIQGEILAALGQSHIRNLSPSSDQVVLCGDYDGEHHSRTTQAMQKTVDALNARGYTVSVVWPAQQGAHKIDFNDILREEGAGRIRQILSEQLEKPGFLQKDAPIISHTSPATLAPSAPPLAGPNALARYQTLREQMKGVKNLTRLSAAEKKAYFGQQEEARKCAYQIEQDADLKQAALTTVYIDKIRQDAADFRESLVKKEKGSLDIDKSMS